MGKRVSIIISESKKELEILYKKTRSYKSRLRIKSLLLTKSNKFKTRLDLSNYLGISLRTLFDWTKLYKTGGLIKLLASTSGGSRNRIISPDVRISLQNKLSDSNNPLQGYNDAVLWVSKNHNINVNYHTLRTYMIVNFGTKLKQPRKSHYKKDEQAFETFKKTPRSI